MEIKDRIDSYRNAKKITVQAFEIMLNASNGSWEKAKSVSEEKIIRFTKLFPEVNPTWLVTGEGSMLLEDIQTAPVLNWLVTGEGSMLLEDIQTAPVLNDKSAELLNLCKSLIDNYHQRDAVMSQLISMVKQME